MKSPKNIQRSMRMTQEIYDYVMSHDGNGFNDKFENLVIKFMESEMILDANIQRKQQLLENLGDALLQYQLLKCNLERVSDYLKYIDDIVKKDIPTLFDD